MGARELSNCKGDRESKMAEFLVGILYYEPEPRSLWERGVIEDYESSTGLFIEADSPEAAIAWGEHVGQSLLRFVNNDSTLDWKTLGNWCWLEESPHTCNWRHCLDFFQHVRVGEMPDVDRMATAAYERWLNDATRRDSPEFLISNCPPPLAPQIRQAGHTGPTSEGIKEPTQEFDDTLNSFKGFLNNQGMNGDIRWIWREDVFTSRMLNSHKHSVLPIFINFFRPNDVVRVRVLYQQGVTRGFGLALRVFCLCDGMACCFIDLPESLDDAAARLIAVTTFKLPKPCFEAIPVTNPFRLVWLRARSLKSTDPWISEIPRRSRVPRA